MNNLLSLILIILCISCHQEKEKINENDSFEEKALEFCLLGLEEAKKAYVNDNQLIVDLGMLDYKNRPAYELVLRGYSKELVPYANIQEQYYKQLDSVIIYQDTFAYFNYCFKQFVDGIIEKRYGSSFYEEVKHKADSLIENETIEKIYDTYYKLYPNDSL